MAKSFNDWMDVADNVMGGVEKALIQPEPDAKGKGFIDVGDFESPEETIRTLKAALEEVLDMLPPSKRMNELRKLTQ